MKKIIINIEKISDEEMKKYELVYPYRITEFWFCNNRIMKHGIPEEMAKELEPKIGKIIEV